MINKILIVSLLLIGTYQSNSQGKGTATTDSPYASRWQIKPLAGINIGLSTVLKNEPTDNLLSYDDKSFYWQFISLTYFYKKHWGIELNFRASTSKKIIDRVKSFDAAMLSKYQSRYYVSTSTGADFSKVNIIGGSIERGYVGMVYRYETNKMYIYPKVSIGVTSYYANWATIYLKERNTNNETKVYYNPSKISQDFTTIAPSIGLGYKLSKRIFVSIDLLTSYFKANTTFVKTVTDLNSNQAVTEEIQYKTNVFTLSAGAGVIVVLSSSPTYH